MPDLFNKLNVLVRSGIRGLAGAEPRRKLSLDKVTDRDIAGLRQRIDRALDDEDSMTAEIKSLQQQAADWDRQADQAVQLGDDATARHAVRQMQIKQQHAAMLQADLEQHRRATSELISRVNELEALAAEARQSPTETATSDESPVVARLRQIINRQEEQPAAAAEPPAEVDAQAVEDDLARRRARLSQ